MRSRRIRPLWQRLRIRWRWGWRRVERRLPRWTRSAAPWGTSLFVHALVLFLMAVVIHFVKSGDDSPEIIELGGQLRDDVISAAPGEQAGDPFTTLDSEDPPSMPRDLTKIDDTVIAVADLPPDIRLASELDLSPDGVMDAADLGNGTKAVAIDPTPGISAPFRGRSSAERAKLVRREGGTVESEQSVERGLDWLARHQRPDGSWSLAANEVCSDPPCPDRPFMQSDVAATGLALLPMLGAGHTHMEKGRYQRTIRSGLDWLMKQQRPDGLIYTGGAFNAMMYSHAIATMALCESYGLTKDKGIRLYAQRAVQYIVRSQHTLGGWRYQALAEGDTSVHGWMIFALRSADIAGIPVSKRVVRQAKRYLDTVAVDDAKSLYAYQPGRGMTHTMTAEALVCRQLLGWPREFPALKQGVAVIDEHLQVSQERNIYYWYYATQLLHNMRDKTAWPRWNQKVRDGLIDLQTKGNGCDRGSWDPVAPLADQWGQSAGRLYTTALSLLTLEVYYRYLPLYKDQGGEIEGAEDAVANAPEGADAKAAGGNP